MPPQHFHITKAERNEQFYDAYALGTSTFNEWAAVVLFYTIMHYLDAVFSCDAGLPADLRQPQTHWKRNSALSKCPSLGPIAKAYMHLYHRSRDARYNQISFPPGFLKQLETSYYTAARLYLRLALKLPP